eukprot:scaffold20140_cov40-Phaeocystis_antarctica.AAC.1
MASDTAIFITPVQPGPGLQQPRRRRRWRRWRGGTDCEMSEALLEAVRGLRVAEPDLGFKPLLAKLREQPDLGAATKEVREALTVLKAESKAAKAAAVPPGANEGGAPPNAALSLACIGCFRL